MANIAISADLMLQSESGEIHLTTGDDQSLKVDFSDWSQLGSGIKFIKQCNLSYSGLKRMLRTISHPVRISIDGNEKFIVTKGSIKSNALLNWLPVIRYYLF